MNADYKRSLGLVLTVGLVSMMAWSHGRAQSATNPLATCTEALKNCSGNLRNCQHGKPPLASNGLGGGWTWITDDSLKETQLLLAHAVESAQINPQSLSKATQAVLQKPGVVTPATAEVHARTLHEVVSKLPKPASARPGTLAPH